MGEGTSSKYRLNPKEPKALDNKVTPGGYPEIARKRGRKGTKDECPPYPPPSMTSSATAPPSSTSAPPSPPAVSPTPSSSPAPAERESTPSPSCSPWPSSASASPATSGRTANR